MKKSDVFAAHIKEERIQSVKQHCENVSAYAAKEAEKVGLSNTLRLAGLFHDIGKNTQAFHNYIYGAVMDSAYKKKINHSSAGGRYLYEILGDLNDIGCLACQLIAYAVVSHHGLTDLVNLSGENYFIKRLYPESDNFYEEVIRNTDFIDKEQVKELFAKAVKEISLIYCQINSITVVPETAYFMMSGLQRLILSFLIDADWLDTSEFMDDTRYERISKESIIKKWNQYQQQLNLYIGTLRQDSLLSKLRSDMSDQCCRFAQNGDGIYRLAIPTGGGKTLAGMRYALELARREEKRHIFYIAPYLSILEQNAHLIKSILKDDAYVMEFHSNMIVPEESEQGNQFSEDWSELVILTTLVQFLNAMFSDDKKSIRRFHQMTNSVIILDEAQSIPIKCLNLFTSMVNFLSYCCHTTVVICTATQPLFEKIQYPLLYSKPADMIPGIDKYQEGFKRTEIVNCSNKSMSTDELSSMVLENLDKNMLIILNTKAAVQRLYQEICSRADGDVQVFQLTTYMCAAHRMDMIEKIKEQLQEGSKRTVCVSTQLVEAGVDISFETVIRSLAGLDSIAQAAGRCNRNAERQLGKVYIVDYADENVSNLPDIRYAQDASKLVMDRFGEELFSQSAMEFYYAQYFYKRECEMKYNLPITNDTLYDLLSCNQKYTPESYTYPLSQSYKTAGDKFKVIENEDMVGIIVPYMQAKEYIQDLKSANSIREVQGCLKKLQRYTVNVYRNDTKLNALIGRKAIDCSLLNGNVYILDDGFYDDMGLNDRLELLAF